MKNANIKRQAVFPVLMMLVVTALALIGSSFAWFTVANTASVAQITTKAQSDGVRLEISQDANRYYTRSIKIDGNAKSAVLPSSLYQVSTSGLLTSRGGAQLKTFEFYNSEFTGFNVNENTEYIVSKQDTSIYDDEGILKETTLNETSYGLQEVTFGEAFDATHGTYIAFDLYFATDRKANIYFYEGTKLLGKDNGSNQYTEDAEILKALRVAVAYIGSTETANEVYKLNADGNSSVTIWQVSGNNTVYGIDKASYGDPSVDFAPYTNAETAANYVAETTTKQADALIVSSTKNTSGKEKMFTTPAPSSEDVTRVYSKVRIYVWLEGNDPDCLSKVAAADIQINLSFFAEDATE